LFALKNGRLIFTAEALTMADTSESNSEGGCRPVLKGTVFHIRIPDDRVFMCGSEPLSVPAMVEALKLFIAEVSTVVFELEIEKDP
jgi:hypothetical protein